MKRENRWNRWPSRGRIKYKVIELFGAWNKTCKNKHISSWMRITRRGKKFVSFFKLSLLPAFFKHREKIITLLKLSIKIVTWQLGSFLNVIVRSSLFPPNFFQFLSWIWRTGENARLNARLEARARASRLTRPFSFIILPAVYSRKSLRNADSRRGPMGQFSMGIEKGFYLAPLLPHSQVKTRFELNRRRTARFPFLFFQIERCPLEVHRSRCYNCEQRGKYYAPKL